VTFSTPNQETLPVPSPDYLVLHAACAKIAHMSGPAEHIDRIQRYEDLIRVLANDVSSAYVLENALGNAMVRHITRA
jgi:hypothetical protein